MRLLWVVVFLFLSACSSETTESPDIDTIKANDGSEVEVAEIDFTPRTFDEVIQSGVLRVLAPKWDEYTALPRGQTPAHRLQIMIAEFAQLYDLDIHWVYVDNFSELIPRLEDGQGDIIVANLTVTEARKEKVDFTVAIEHVAELVVVKSVQDAADIHQLGVASVVIPQGSAFKETLDDMAKAEWTVVEKSEDADPQSLVDDVLADRYTAAILDSNIAEIILEQQPEVKTIGSLGRPRDIAWAVHKDSGEMQKKLNDFLYHYLVVEANISDTGDWQDITQRHTLRMITRNSPDSYFMWRGELMGYEYDLVKRFAKENGLYLDVIVLDAGDMIGALLDGRGDLIASSQARLDSRRARGVEFTRPYHFVDEVLIGRAGLAIEELEDLAGAVIMVEPGSSYLQRLEALQAEGAQFEIQLANPEVVSDETDLLALIEDGVIDFTVADSHLAQRELLDNEKLAIYLAIEEDIGHGWAVRKDNTELLAKLNAYIKKNYRGLFFNVAWQKYFDGDKGRYLGIDPLSQQGRLSPYDDIVRNVAGTEGFDWRMIVSQMYQESRFNPKAKSRMGARGLMQIMPKTAKRYGSKDLFDPTYNIETGVTYLSWVRDRFPSKVLPSEKLFFSLAAYNAGHGHVRDAIRLARQKGWDSTRWFGNVEKAMLLLSKREYARKARFGYVRGREPVEYVRQIHRRYLGYVTVAK
jgi:membrane-bound lytic murein transglycosylase F